MGGTLAAGVSKGGVLTEALKRYRKETVLF